MEKITEIEGFNYLGTNDREIGEDEEIFLRRKNRMISLGTLHGVMARVDPGMNSLIGIDNKDYGMIADKAIYDNLFVRDPRYTKVLSSAVRDKKVNLVGAENILSYLPKESDKLLNNYAFRKGTGKIKRKRNKRKQTKRRK